MSRRKLSRQSDDIILYHRTTQPGFGVAPAQDAPPIYYMEAEVNSPVVELYPGESYAMDTQWYPTRMGSEFKGQRSAEWLASRLPPLGKPTGWFFRERSECSMQASWLHTFTIAAARRWARQ